MIEHEFALPEPPDNVHEPAENVPPAPLSLQVTNPLGVEDVPRLVSTTTAVQETVDPTGADEEVHATDVVVAPATTNTKEATTLGPTITRT